MFSKKAMFGLVLLWVMTTAAQEPYCVARYKRLCQNKGHHIACLYPDPGPGAACTNYSAIEFNQDMKSFILHYLNRRRQRIASGKERVRGGVLLPKPELMMLVMWDRELAYLAQRLADQCNFVHDDCRATVRYPYAGQAVGEVRWRGAGAGGARRATRRVLDAWWGERRRVSPAQLTSPFRLSPRGAIWGHFSQLCVWNLQAMGCGAVQHGASRLLLVCDFSHTNMLGQRTLTPGPLAPCPVHTVRSSSQYPLLCTPVRKPIPKEPEEDYDEELDSVPREMTTDVIIHPRIESYSRQTQWAEATAMFKELLWPESQTLRAHNEELYGRRKAEHKIHRLDEEWNRSPGHPDTQQQLNDFENVIPLRQTAARWDDQKVIELQTSTSNYPRLRWKQTRDRPVRPGANALISTQSQQFTKRLSVAPLMLDNDDVVQLYQDTGFKMTRKTTTT